MSPTRSSRTKTSGFAAASDVFHDARLRVYGGAVDGVSVYPGAGIEYRQQDDADEKLSTMVTTKKLPAAHQRK